MQETNSARATYDEALRSVDLRKVAQLWICASDFEQLQNANTKARTILQKGRLKIDSELIWAESIRLEIKEQNTQIAQNLCSQSLQKFPKSGLLWSLAIQLETPNTRKSKSQDALKNASSSPWVLLEIAKLFQDKNKPVEHRKFIMKALEIEPDNGDVWIEFYKIEKTQETLDNFDKADPAHGYRWPKVFKKVENWSKPKKEILK